jgi:hypothetical protein
MAAAKKSSTRKKGSAKKPTLSRKRSELELPATLDEFGTRLRRMLSDVEREIEQAFPSARRKLARVLRETSHELGRLEERGERAFRRSAKAATRDTQGLLQRVSKALEEYGRGKPQSAKKKAAKRAGAVKRKAAAKQKATPRKKATLKKKATARKKPSARKKAASRKRAARK